MSALVLVDASHLAYRSFFAYRDLKRRDGKGTGVLYGFLRALLGIKRRVGNRIVFCWDYGYPGRDNGKVTPWRKRLSKSYKANRKMEPAVRREVQRQMAVLRSCLLNLGYSDLGVPGLEADDVIGLITGAALDRLLESSRCSVIYSGDRDFYQLLDPKIKILRPDWKEYTMASLRRELALTPEAYAWYLALGGEGSDNVRAIKGVGPKTAWRMAVAGVAPSLQTPKREWLGLFPVLEKHWPSVRRAYQLVRIPVSFSDPRIIGLVPPRFDHLIFSLYRDYDGDMNNPAVSGLTAGPDRAARRDKFVRFCTAWEMNYFLQERKRFLN